MDHTVVLERNMESETRFTVNQGGTGSSKTISLVQLFILRLLQGTGVISVVRKTMPALRTTGMRDFFSFLSRYGLYYESNHNKSEDTYRLGATEIEFFGLDQPQKVRGRKREWLWLNEANEFSYEDFTQLNLRTSGRVFMDYNPSDEYHWIYDKVLPREDCTFIKSTYKDNPFLDPGIVAEIERLKTEDPDYWRIYGEGEIGQRKSVIYRRWTLVDDFPAEGCEIMYGLDFGFNNPTALVKIGIRERELYINEEIYQSGLTNAQLMEYMDAIVEGESEIVADCEDPQRIEEIARYARKGGKRFNVHAAVKGKDSVRKGIDAVKSFAIHLTKRSANIQKEIRGYKWKEDRDHRVLDEPVKFMDHGMDAIRYPVNRRASRLRRRATVTIY